jgi:hypothetical protein
VGNGPGHVGGHRGDLGLRGCAVGMCRRRLRSWQVPIIILVIMIIIIIILTVIVTMIMVQSPAWPASWLMLVTYRAASAVGGSGLWQVRSGRELARAALCFLGQHCCVVGRSAWPSSAQCHGGGLKRSKLASPGDVRRAQEHHATGPCDSDCCSLSSGAASFLKVLAIMMLPALVKRYD